MTRFPFSFSNKSMPRKNYKTHPNPLGYTCNWLIDGVRCGQVFQKKWDLTKHKNTLGHKTTVVKN